MSSAASPRVARSTVASTWRWMWPDFLMRIVPLAIVPFAYIALFHLPLVFLGLAWGNVPFQVGIGLLVAIVMTVFAIVYRMYIVGPWFRWPTISDHFLQGSFYLLINGPVEELFFRGFVLAAVTQWTGRVGWGWLVSTVVYTLYHKLGKWSWRSVGGVGLAALVFSTLYIALPGPRSLLAVAIVHGFTTSGFLSWGDEALYRRWRFRQARQVQQATK